MRGCRGTESAAERAIGVQRWGRQSKNARINSALRGSKLRGCSYSNRSMAPTGSNGRLRRLVGPMRGRLEIRLPRQIAKRADQFATPLFPIGGRQCIRSRRSAGRVRMARRSRRPRISAPERCDWNLGPSRILQESAQQFADARDRMTGGRGRVAQNPANNSTPSGHGAWPPNAEGPAVSRRALHCESANPVLGPSQRLLGARARAGGDEQETHHRQTRLQTMRHLITSFRWLTTHTI